MLKILTVTSNDFDKVYPLLTRIPSPIPISQETWRRLFSRQWDGQVEPLGYVLINEGEIVGYIGLITVHRRIGGQVHEIMDLTSWTVDKKYSGYAIKMLSSFIHDHSRTLRCFTPAKSVDLIFRRFGFQELTANLHVIPFWSFNLGLKDFQITFDIQGHQALLLKEDWQIYHDHHKLSSEHFIFKNGQSYCYVVAKRVWKKKLPFLHIHYVSDKKLFAQTIGKFTVKICVFLKIFGLIVFENYLGQEKIKGIIKLNMSSKPLYRGFDLKPENMDSLYSEYFVLNF